MSSEDASISISHGELQQGVECPLVGALPKTPFSIVWEYQDPVHPADDEKTVGGGPPAQDWRGKSCSVHYRKNAGSVRPASSSLPRNMAEQDALPNPVLERTGVTFVTAGARH